MCGEHYEIYRDALATPIAGIDPPNGASEFWHPSLFDMLRLANIKIRFDERPRDQPAALHRPGDDRYTSAQLRQVMVLRRALGQ